MTKRIELSDGIVNSECIQEWVDEKMTKVCGCLACWPESQGCEEEEE